MLNTFIKLTGLCMQLQYLYRDRYRNQSPLQIYGHTKSRQEPSGAVRNRPEQGKLH